MIADFVAFLPGLLAIAHVVVAVPLTVLVALLLWRLSLQAPKVRVLRERAHAASALATIVVVFAIIFINNGLAVPPLNNFATQIITRATLLVVVALSSLFWLRLYRGAT